MRRVAIGAMLGGMAVMGAAGAAWGQIAAPSLAPGTFSSENPAAIKWGAPSRFGAGYLAEHDTNTPSNQHTDYTGASGGFRLVGESLALGFETQGKQDQEDNLHDERGTSSAALAVQTGPVLAWGLGYNAFNQTLNSAKTATKEPDLGLSLRLGEIWFIGGTVGRESTSHKDQLAPATEFYGDRDVVRAGIGFRRGGTVLMHMEAFAINKRDYDTTALGKFGGESTSGGTVEFTFWSFLLGGSARHTKVHATLTDTIDLMTADIGYAPREGLSLTLHYESQKVVFKQQPTDLEPPTLKSELGTVQLTYQF